MEAGNIQQHTGAPRCPYNSAARNNMGTSNQQQPASMAPWQTYAQQGPMYHRAFDPASTGWSPGGPIRNAPISHPYLISPLQTWPQSTYVPTNTRHEFPEPQPNIHNQEGLGGRPFPSLPPISGLYDYPWAGQSWRTDAGDYDALNGYSSGASSSESNSPPTQSGAGFSATNITHPPASRVPSAQVDQATQVPSVSSTITHTLPPHQHTFVHRAQQNWDRPNARRRRLQNEPNFTADSDSEDDYLNEFQTDMIEENLEAIFGFAGRNGMDEERALAAMRGIMASTKRIPSKDFMASLEKVRPEDLPEADRSCIICYNDFGVMNPEGISEDPVRLPKCKHVFGLGCIKKWFEENDSCPYCRDKIPSESARKLMFRHNRQMHPSGDRTRHNFSAPHTTAMPDEGIFGNATVNQAIENYRYNQSLAHFGRPPTDPAETRRRLPRGRAGSHRANHLPTRPTSVSSPRLHPIASQAQVNRQAPQFVPHPNVATYSHRRPGPPFPNNQASVNGQGYASTSEGASPAIAIGSGAANGNGHTPPIVGTTPSGPAASAAATPTSSSPARPIFGHRSVHLPIFGAMEIDHPPYYNPSHPHERYGGNDPR